MTFNMELTQSYLTLLREETLPAIGCTEPVAVALCAAEASACLLKEPYRLHLEVSPYILKNGMHVGIPGTAGLTGLDLACALGSLLPHPEKQMTILGDVSDEKLSKARAIVQSGSVSVRSADTPYKVWVDVRIDAADGHWARAVIQGTHTHVLLVEKDGQPLRTDRCQESESRDMPAITLESVYAFATTVSQADLEFLDEIIRVNTRIACEGLARDYGLCVGRHLANSPDAAQQVIAVTAAAADARMSGCQLPVMTNMGSGNQGITASLPVIETAHLLGASREQLLRALAISELVAMEVKTHIGRLSALCGCSIAAAIGAASAMVFLRGGNFEQIAYAVNMMVGDVTGIICDGAKPGCALKIATAVSAAQRAAVLALSLEHTVQPYGIVSSDVEATIQNLGTLGRDGMGNANDVVLRMMLDGQHDENVLRL
ncbi:MAG: serine dehydratase subunit alpha family protein [Christensenellales bacterium]